MTQRPPKPQRATAWALALLLHLVLAAVVQLAVTPAANPTAPVIPAFTAAPPVQWLLLQPLAVAKPTPPKRPSLKTTMPAPSTAALPAAAPPAAVWVPPAPEALAAPATPSPPQPAASSAQHILDGDAALRALAADAVRRPGLVEQARQAGHLGHSSTPQERLAKGVQQAGHGDCLKGGYAGGGMGLLSAPFLAAAALSGRCAK